MNLSTSWTSVDKKIDRDITSQGLPPPYSPLSVQSNLIFEYRSHALSICLSVYLFIVPCLCYVALATAPVYHILSINLC